MPGTPRNPPRRARYADAIDWIAAYDDTQWLGDADEDLILSVTASLVADLFGRTEVEVTRDLRRALKRHGR